MADSELATPNYIPKAASVLTLDFNSEETQKGDSPEGGTKEDADAKKELLGSDESKTEKKTTETSEEEEGSTLTNEPERESGTQPAKTQLTPEMQALFNQQYAHAEEWKRQASEIAAANTAMAQKIAAMERERAIEKFDYELQTYTLAKERALAAGDHGAVAQIDNKLIELKAKEAEVKKPLAQAKSPTQPQKNGIVANEKFQSWVMPRAEALQAWFTETDAKGIPLRPWIDPAHPQHKIACAEMGAVIGREPGGDIATWLPELDRRMGRVSNGQRTGITAPSTSRRPSLKPTLSPAQKQIAAKMGLSEADYASELAPASRS